MIILENLHTVAEVDDSNVWKLFWELWVSEVAWHWAVLPCEGEEKKRHLILARILWEDNEETQNTEVYKVSMLAVFASTGDILSYVQLYIFVL